MTGPGGSADGDRTGLGVGVVALVFYLTTLAPGLVWGDGARLQTDAITGASLYWQFDELAAVQTDGYLFERLGVAAWDHPLWVMVGHGLVNLPIGTPNRWLNLLSAVPAAVCVGSLVSVGRRLGLSSIAATFGAGALAVSHTFWLHAVTAEVYALHAAFMVALLCLVLDPAGGSGTGSRSGTLDGSTPVPVGTVAAFAGLGMSNHLLLGLTVGGVAIHMLVARGFRPTRRQVGWSALAFLIGFAPWLVQFVRMTAVVGWDTTVAVAWGFPWLGDRWPGPVAQLPMNLARYLGLLVVQFTPFGVGLGLVGIRTLWRRCQPEATLIIGLFAVHAGFSSNYLVADQFAFHLPSYVLFALFCAAGVDTLIDRVSPLIRPTTGGLRLLPAAGLVAGLPLALIILPVAAYNITPALLRGAGLDEADLGVPAVGVDGRDGFDYYLNPNSAGDDSAARFGSGALDSVEPNALILTAWPGEFEAYIAMRHHQLTEGRRLDVTLDMLIFTAGPLDEAMLAIAHADGRCRPLYLSSANPAVYPLDRLAEQFEIREESHLYRLEPLIPESDPECRAAERRTVDDFDELLKGLRR